MRTMVNLGIVKLDEKMNICCSTQPQDHRGYTNSSLVESDLKVRNCDAMLFLKGLCQLESMRSEVMQITFNCQNSIVFNA